MKESLLKSALNLPNIPVKQEANIDCCLTRYLHVVCPECQRKDEALKDAVDILETYYSEAKCLDHTITCKEIRSFINKIEAALKPLESVTTVGHFTAKD